MAARVPISFLEGDKFYLFQACFLMASGKVVQSAVENSELPHTHTN